VADSRFILLSANDAAKRILGEPDLKARRLEELLSRFQHTFDREALPGRNIFRIVSSRGGPDAAERRVYAATVSENRGSDHDCWKYVICLHDVTQVERNERMKSLLVNRLAHKLRTPLTVITGVNTLVAQQMGSHMDAELLGMLEQSLQHSQQCAEMIDKFVEYTTVNLGHDNMPEARCRLEALVAFAADANRDMVREKRFSVSKEFPDDTFEFRGREEKLSLVFHHVVQNAVKFGDVGGNLAISAERVGDLVRVCFRDDGPGIPREEKEYLFQMLHQVDAENTGQVPGAGLGLWLARAVLQAHGGEISITSPVTDDRRGTLVEVVLPAAEGAQLQPVDARMDPDTVPLE
jgi:signal transduction histidine kinase